MEYGDRPLVRTSMLGLIKAIEIELDDAIYNFDCERDDEALSGLKLAAKYLVTTIDFLTGEAKLPQVQ